MPRYPLKGAVVIGRYKNRIIWLSAQLQQLAQNLTNLELLFDLQRQVLKQIQHTEKRISTTRTGLQKLRHRLGSERLPKLEAKGLRGKIATVQGEIVEYHRLLFFWRSFGDGIAFAYLDKWSMKQVLFNTHNTEVKPNAGFITGKEGLKNELAALRKVMSMGVPCLLTDLTNCIRHGDLCLLTGPDPELLEIKSSRNTNRRIARQLDSLRALHEFLQTDESKNLRGLGQVKRVESRVPEKNYLDLLDYAVGTALAKGLFVADLEPGTRLMVLGKVRKPNYAALFAGLNAPYVFLLNQCKNEQTWGCYYPFSLSLKTPEHLYAFLRGDISIVVAFDFLQIRTRAQELGFELKLLDDGDYSFRFEQFSNGPMPSFAAQMSRQFSARIAVELLSWEWILTDLKSKSQHSDILFGPPEG
jgi:hypothetical protein